MAFMSYTIRNKACSGLHSSYALIIFTFLHHSLVMKAASLLFATWENLLQDFNKSASESG